MEEPEEAGSGSPSPEYRDPIEAEALMEEPKEAGAGARSPSPEYVAPGSRIPSPETEQGQDFKELGNESTQVNKNKYVTQVSTRRARSGERLSSEVRQEQEKWSRRSRSPEHAAAIQPGNRSRRLSNSLKADAGTMRGGATGRQPWRSPMWRLDQGG